MADTYIDYWEVSEYGRHFLRRTASLQDIPGSPVDVTRLRALVEQAMQAVEAERQDVSTRGSTLRVGRDDTTKIANSVRDNLRRFYHYLRSLPRKTSFDMDGFFSKGQLGPLERLKPADVLCKCESVLHAFGNPGNATLPRAAEWRAELETGRVALALALGDKSDAQGDSSAGKGALVAARAGFLRVYNGMAKRLVRGLLIHLGREREYKLFFRDLQISEAGPGTGESNAPADDDDFDPSADPDASEL